MERLIVCVTGCMAAGKNVVSTLLEEEGFVSVDADLLVHDAVEKSKLAIIKEFGDAAEKKGINLLNPDGTLDRRALGRIVFSDSDALKRHESIIHPAVDSMINEFIDSKPNTSIVINATVLYKTPVIARCNCIIFVDAPMFIRFFRVVKRDKLPFCQIISRFKSQRELFSQYKKCGADIYRVRNIGRRRMLQRKLKVIMKHCLSKGN